MGTKLTEAAVGKAVKAGVPAGKAHLMLWDAAVTGLGLKLRPSGSCSWVFTYRPRGAGRSVASRTVTLGGWPTVSVDAARAAAQSHAGAVAGGADPAVALREERRRERRVLASALDDYEKALKARRIVNADTNMSTLRRGLAGLLQREVSELSRADYVEKIEAIETAGKPGAAADLRKNARAFAEWAVTRGLAAYNPLAGLRRPKASRADKLEQKRRLGRALSDEEIATVWAATAGGGAFNNLVRLGLLTGLRRSELAGLRWQDIKADRITLAAERTKTGALHEVPLTPAMVAVIQAQPRIAGCDLVFASGRRAGGTAISGWSKLLPKLVSRSAVDFTMHDCRRTLRTLMSRLGVAEEIAELSIGHVRSGLVGTYNKDDGWKARTAAFDAVSDHISALVTGSADPATVRAVVPLRPKKRAVASRAK